MASKTRIAILVPNLTNYTETFIRNHVELLPFDKVVIHGGRIPHLLGDGLWTSIVSFSVRLIRTIFGEEKSKIYRKRLLKNILKRSDVHLVFVEYLNRAATIWQECNALDLPLIGTGLGVELSNKKTLHEHSDLYRGYLDYAAFSILVAKPMIETLVELGGDRRKLVWSASGARSDFFALKPDFRSKKLVAIGRFVEKKAPQITIEAFSIALKEHADAELVMAGDGVLLEMCRKRVSELGIADKVKFLGRIDQTKQKELLSNCRAFVQHSVTARNGDREGTPVAILEAMAAGVPVVATYHSGISDCIENERNGFLVDEYDTKKMACHMRRLLDDHNYARSIGAKGRAHVLENYTIENHIATIAKCINIAVSKRWKSESTPPTFSLDE